MPTEKHGILGQAAPAASTDTALYTVPAGRKATISTLVAANTSGGASSYRYNARINGTAAAPGNEIAHDIPLANNASDGVTWGIALGPGDVLNVRSGAAGGITFTAFGVEEDLV